jgi:hypothetical protein
MLRVIEIAVRDGLGVVDGLPSGLLLRQGCRQRDACVRAPLPEQDRYAVHVPGRNHEEDNCRDHRAEQRAALAAWARCPVGAGIPGASAPLAGNIPAAAVS